MYDQIDNIKVPRITQRPSTIRVIALSVNSEYLAKKCLTRDTI